MVNKIIPIKLKLTVGSFYTLRAPYWRELNNEWEAFLGLKNSLYCFESLAALISFVHTNNRHDLINHPAWNSLTKFASYKLYPPKEYNYDLIGLPALFTNFPTKKTVIGIYRALELVSSLGYVCKLTLINKFINGNPILRSINGSIENFSYHSGHKHWNEIETVIDYNWYKVLDSINKIILVPKFKNLAIFN